MNQMETRKSKVRRQKIIGTVLTCIIVLNIGVSCAPAMGTNNEDFLTDIQMMNEVFQKQNQELIELNKVRNPYLENVSIKINSYEGYIDDEHNNALNELIKKSYKCNTRDEFNLLISQFDDLLAAIDQIKKEAEEAAEIARQAELETQQENTVSYENIPDLKTAGVIYYNGWRFTWYSSNILYHYRTSEWHTNSQGFWCDENGYLIAASSTLSQGSILDTPWGTAIIRDSGCASDVIDMYVCW